MGRFQWSIDHSWTRLLTRSSLISRRRRRKQIFGCDLITLLNQTNRRVPLVLQCCCEFVEQFGLIDGVYRLSGVSSNIHKLRLAFDNDKIPDLSIINGDVHAVASLLKLFFRLLPDPLLTFALHDAFLESINDKGNKLERIKNVIQMLPVQHRNTLSYLIKHLARVSQSSNKTAMNAKNLSIVWAPNLLRSKELECGGAGVGVAALHIIGSQAILIEFLITNCYKIFVDDEVEDQENDNQMIVLHHNESFKRKHNNKTWKFWSSPTRLRLDSSDKFELCYAKTRFQIEPFEICFRYEPCYHEEVTIFHVDLLTENAVETITINEFYFPLISCETILLSDKNSRARIEAYKEKRRATLRQAYLAKQQSIQNSKD